MGKIQSSVGLISGIDIDSTVTKLIAVSARPRDALQARTATLQSQQAAITDLLAQVIGIQISTDRLGRVSDFNAITATSSKRDVLTATADSTTIPGNYRFQSVATAQTSSLTSNTFTSADQRVSAGTLTVNTGGFLDGSVSLDNLQGGVGVSRGKILITDRAGNSSEIDLRFAATVDDVLKAINTNKNIKVSASVSGDRIVLKDLTGQTTSNLIVADVNGGQTAADLGLDAINTSGTSATGDDLVYLSNATSLSTLRDGRGLRFGNGNDINVTLRDGTSLQIDLNSSTDGNPVTLGQLLDRINAASPTKFQARVSSNGETIEVEDLTSGSGNFSLVDASGNVSEDLGIEQSTTSSTITGKRVQSGLNGPLLSSLLGGKGVGTLGTIAITNRTGTTTSIDLSSAKTVRDVIDTINASNAGVIASTNSTGVGIAIQDTTGSSSSNLIVANGDGTNSATTLKLAQSVAKATIDSGSLGLQFVHENTELSKLNQGRGVNLGSVKFTDSLGAEATLNFSANVPKTLGDVMNRINNSGLAIRAELNDAGDGLVVTDTGNGTGNLTIANVSSTGTFASDLGIAGTAATLTVNGVTKKGIESNQNLKLTLTSSDKLSDVVSKIQDAKGPIGASILRSGPSNVRLLINSKASGAIGRVTIDGGTTGISLTSTTQGRDAIVAIGASEDFGGTLIQSSSNTFEDIVPGLDVTITGTNSEVIDVNVTSGASGVSKNVQAFVDQFNKVIGKLKDATKFDPDGRKNGVLFGSSEALRVEFSLTKLISTRLSGVGSSIRSLEQLGLRIDSDGKLNFDTAKFQDALDANPEEVEAFFTKEEKGFSAVAKSLIDEISGVDNSVLTSRNDAIQRKIDDNNERIAAMNLRLEAEKTRLQNRFYSLERTIATLQTSQKAIASLSVVTLNTSR